MANPEALLAICLRLSQVHWLHCASDLPILSLPHLKRPAFFLPLGVASVETLTPRNTAGGRRFYTFSPARCAAFSRAHNRQRIQFPSPAFPVLPESPCLSAATAPVPARQIRCQSRTTPSPRRSCDGRGAWPPRSS